MPTIYITKETRAKIDLLTAKEKRDIAGEIDLLCENRLKELGLPDLNQTSNVPNSLPKTQMSCQGVNHV